MKSDNANIDQMEYWEQAGSKGYENAIYSSQIVMKHNRRRWQAAVQAAKLLGLSKSSKIIELGCGDGAFAENILAPGFGFINAYDYSETAIKRAKSRSKSKNVHYAQVDITTYNFKENTGWDGAFLMGLLHHVKDYAPEIVLRLSKVCPTVIVFEPNGDNIIRKFLELSPSYKLAGDKSIKIKELINLFESNGYKTKIIHRMGFIPPFLPGVLLKLFKRLEDMIEASRVLNKMCASCLFGFQRVKQ